MHSAAGAGLNDAQFLFGVLIPAFGLFDSRLNIEAMSSVPLFTIDDHWRLATLGGHRDPLTGLVADDTPPYAPYLANLNHVGPRGNPLAPENFELRWYAKPWPSCHPSQ